MQCVRIIIIALIVLLHGGTPALADEPAGEQLGGKLLVADSSMRDPRFVRSVIYLVRHDAAGAFGLIINKPLTKLPLAKVLSHMQLETEDTPVLLDLYFGGPVEEDLGFVLHSPDFAVPDATLTVGGGFAVTGVRQVLRAISAHKGPAKAMFAIGYASWEAGQLEAELERGDWNVVDADETLVFDLPVAKKWQVANDRRTLKL